MPRFWLPLALTVVLSLALGGAVLFTFEYFTDPDEVAQKAVEYRQKQKQDAADRVISAVRYVEDAQTGICFAYAQTEAGHYSRSVLSITVVPENMVSKIPPELLTVVGKKKD